MRTCGKRQLSRVAICAKAIVVGVCQAMMLRAQLQDFDGILFLRGLLEDQASLIVMRSSLCGAFSGRGTWLCLRIPSTCSVRACRCDRLVGVALWSSSVRCHYPDTVPLLAAPRRGEKSQVGRHYCFWSCREESVPGHLWCYRNSPSQD